ncbi:hypothetical protein AERO_18345 [Aeromicrobium fastidiosum]|uniref:hypothetical protein n=1 Tax=Aeromicrobium fastidiosum TaxID=52699 RepID=UPI002023496F|nr:hypothetical protein [Aeromicrobium fastidiosum]MCL8253343.1 hypothetical protein [Aeromicrobium fastidiosum]
MSSSGTPVARGVGPGPVVVTAERVEAPADEPHVDRDTTAVSYTHLTLPTKSDE